MVKPQWTSYDQDGDKEDLKEAPGALPVVQHEMSKHEAQVITDATVLHVDDLKDADRDELLHTVLTLRRAVASQVKHSPYARQRVASSILSEHVVRDLVGPEGEGGEGTLYGSIKNAAMGYEHRTYCKTNKCTNRGKLVRCQGCNQPATIRDGPDWKAVESLLKFVVPEATVSDETLQEEFIAEVGRAALDAFDEANGSSDPTERKTLFAEGLKQRFGD